MKIFFDTEFLDEAKDGQVKVSLISIGLVREDGKELYLENAEFDLDQPMDPWMKENVIPHLLGPAHHLSQDPEEIADQIREFAGEDPEFWAYVGAYDWIALMSVYGPLIHRPRGWPIWCRDLKALIEQKNADKTKFPAQSGQEHNALEDARWNLELYRYLQTL